MDFLKIKYSDFKFYVIISVFPRKYSYSTWKRPALLPFTFSSYSAIHYFVTYTINKALLNK
jgi:hypothetical protein